MYVAWAAAKAHIAQLRRATTCLRSGVVAERNYLTPSAGAVDKRSNPTFKVTRGESSKVRSSSYALLEQP